MSKIKLIAVDVDGTITISSDKYLLYTPAVEVISELSKKGYYVVLVSGNSIPMIIGLSRYVGASDIAIAENGGAIIFGDEIMWLCTNKEQETLEELEKIVSEKFREFLRSSWQNTFMRCSKAFKRVSKDIDAENIIRDIKSHLKDLGFENLFIASSKIAIHINFSRYTKGYALEKILEKLNLSWGNVLAIGDSDIDVDMIERAEIGCAVANASKRLREVAKCFSGYEAGRGFVDIVERYVLKKEFLN
ncbi:MAG: phosphoglycolate phosphatase [Sulfolobales archaeon]